MRLPLTHRSANRQPRGRGLAPINPPGRRAFPGGPPGWYGEIRASGGAGYREREGAGNGVDRFHTDRLLAERQGPGDFEELYRLRQDPRVAATLGGILSDERARALFDADLVHWARYGFGIWLFRSPVDGSLVGRCGLRRVEVEGRAEVELLYALHAGSWGRGLATEMAAAVLHVGFEQLGLDEVVAFTRPTNTASRRVMEKVGMRYERDFIHANEQHVLFRITSPDWNHGPVRERVSVTWP